MRYWAYLVGKLAVAAAFLYGILALLLWNWPAETPFLWFSSPPRFGYDLTFTLAVLVWFLLCAAALHFILLDQRYRCRVCLRRLRMPVETGSWGQMLQFGRPRIEYICPYGHGTLKEEEVQFSGLSNSREWTRNSDDVWEELCASNEESDGRP
ncbi:MAG TPA: hypothetical protein VG675_10495 [Bryobacteraceae bacterium]|nr:hypothetical protein [Bryobacteraceae bacterium]